MAESFDVAEAVQRFDGERGWFYVELPDNPGFDLRQRVVDTWPQLLRAQCSVGATTWSGSIMPVQDGPLFITLTKPVRIAEGINIGDDITIQLTLEAAPE